MKKMFICLLAVIVTVMLAATFTACNPSGNSDKLMSGKGGNDIAFSIGSSAAMLGDIQNDSATNVAVSLTVSEGALIASEGSLLTEEEKEEVKQQLSVLENFIGENAITSTDEKVGADDTYSGTYENLLTIKTKDLTGYEIVYKLYYNLTEKGEPITRKDGGETETIQAFTLDGIVINGEATDEIYTVSGGRTIETETEGLKEEVESKLSFVITQTEGEYIRFVLEEEIEGSESEQEYKYSYYNNNKLVKEFSIEYEQENNENGIEMKTYENGEVFAVEYEKKTVGGKERIEAEIMKEGISREIIITVEGDGSEANPYRHIYRWGETDIDEDYYHHRR